MSRKEMYEFIKTHNLKDDANRLARHYTNRMGVNFTNLPTHKLEEFVKARCTTKSENKPVSHKCKNTGCIDQGARKAILSIGKILNIKGLEKNFE